MGGFQQKTNGDTHFAGPGPLIDIDAYTRPSDRVAGVMQYDNALARIQAAFPNGFAAYLTEIQAYTFSTITLGAGQRLGVLPGSGSYRETTSQCPRIVPAAATATFITASGAGSGLFGGVLIDDSAGLVTGTVYLQSGNVGYVDVTLLTNLTTNGKVGFSLTGARCTLVKFEGKQPSPAGTAGTNTRMMVKSATDTIAGGVLRISGGVIPLLLSGGTWEGGIGHVTATTETTDIVKFDDCIDTTLEDLVLDCGSNTTCVPLKFKNENGAVSRNGITQVRMINGPTAGPYIVFDASGGASGCKYNFVGSFIGPKSGNGTTANPVDTVGTLANSTGNTIQQAAFLGLDNAVLDYAAAGDLLDNPGQISLQTAGGTLVAFGPPVDMTVGINQSSTFSVAGAEIPSAAAGADRMILDLRSYRAIRINTNVITNVASTSVKVQTSIDSGTNWVDTGASVSTAATGTVEGAWANIPAAARIAGAWIRLLGLGAVGAVTATYHVQVR